MNDEREERLIKALETIGQALWEMAAIQRDRLARDFPPQPETKEARFAKAKYKVPGQEEAEPANEASERWIGPREAALSSKRGHKS